MNYEIQIYAKDRTKIIRLTEENASEPTTQRGVMVAWEDYYFALGSVIDDKADRIHEQNKVIGRLEVKEIPFDDVIDMMCEDLSPRLTQILANEQEVSVIDQLY